MASDTTGSRTITALVTDAPHALAAVRTARAAARARAWQLAARHAPNHDNTADAPLVIDLDATLVTAHSDKKLDRPTFKRGYGFHPLTAFIDHGTDGTGKPLAIQLQPGNAGSNTAVDHIDVTRHALRQLAGRRTGPRPGRKVLIRTDGAGFRHAFLAWLTSQRLSYSIGFGLPDDTADRLQLIPERIWVPAYDADGHVRPGVCVAEITGLLDLRSWPAGMRVIVRKERPHPGAQLRLTDVDGHRLNAFATTPRRTGPGSQLANLELRHRRRARCEDRIRNAKDTGGCENGSTPRERRLAVARRPPSPAASEGHRKGTHRLPRCLLALQCVTGHRHSESTRPGVLREGTAHDNQRELVHRSEPLRR